MPARTFNRLTAREVANASDPGRYADGGGLYLHITQSEDVSGRRWIFRYTSPVTGKIREMGLGAAERPRKSARRKTTPEEAGVSLASARELASRARATVKAGLDPIQERNAARAKGQLEQFERKTFEDAVAAFLEQMEVSWRNAKHRQQWHNTLATYCKPIASLPVDQIGTEEVLGVLRPIWQSKPETASRLRGRIERVLSFAKTLEWREGPNPAVWRGSLDTVLPKPDKLSRGHHRALPYAEVPRFMAELREQEALSARLLEFTILTACRTQETMGAKWEEIDLESATWTIPPERMKARRQHRVPLSSAAIALLVSLRDAAVSEYVFPGRNHHRPLSNMTMLALLDRMGRRGDTTAHGFRSAFSDWCSEQTDFSAEVREMALAHTIKNKAEAAYRRGDLLEKRRELMEAWAAWCAGGDGSQT
ncbi:MAG: tyrosine-type recombinase/integrase [Pseudomonadota bacterium]